MHPYIGVSESFDVWEKFFTSISMKQLRKSNPRPRLCIQILFLKKTTTTKNNKQTAYGLIKDNYIAAGFLTA